MLNIGTIGIVAVAVGMLLALWQGDRAVQRAKGAAAEVSKTEERSNTNSRKAEAARRSVDTLPADGLRDRWFRD